jgi:hypothetical protein
MQGSHDPGPSQWDLGPIPCRLATGAQGTTADGPCGSARRCGAPASAMSGVRRGTVGARRRAPPGAGAARLLARADMAGVAARGSSPQALRVDAIAAGAHDDLQRSAARGRPACSVSSSISDRARWAPRCGRSGATARSLAARSGAQSRASGLAPPRTRTAPGGVRARRSRRLHSACRSARRPQTRALALTPALAAVVAEKLSPQWNSSADRRLAEDGVFMPIR